MGAEQSIADVPDQDACHHFFARSSNLLCVAGFDGYFKQLNPKWEHVLGFTREELRAAPLQSFVHPEDRATVVAATSALPETEKLLSWRCRYGCKDGSFRLFEWEMTTAPERRLMYGVVRDITDRGYIEGEQHAGREPLEYLLRSSLVVLYCSKVSGDFGATFLSSNVTAQFGYEPREFLEDSAFWVDHIHPDDRERVLADLTQLFADGQYTHEYRFLHKNGTYRWVHDDCKVVKDAEGNALEVVGWWQDITERKEAESKIQEQAAALNRLSTPIIPISDQVIVMPLIGLVDSLRASQITETLLQGVADTKARVAILDVTGVAMLDTSIANALLQAAKAVRLLGAQLVLTGMRPSVAQTVVTLGVDLGSIVSCGTLQAGILHAMREVRSSG